MLVTRRPQADPALRARLDPGYWHPAYGALLERCRAPLQPLGDFIRHLTYGPIVTGPAAPPLAEGVVVIHQGQVAETGVDPRGAVRVAPGSPWDAARARLQAGDIALPRSGEASVGRNRVALFLGEYDAVVGSFVDLVRVEGLDPAYTLLCLKTELVWSQIHRFINGVGTPNISFTEVRALQVPVLSGEMQLDFRRRYHENVHTAHLQCLQGDGEAGERGRAALRALVDELNGMVTGPPT